jgi:ribosomal protein L11 methyltransferase
MIELRCAIPEELSQLLEDFFCELPRSPWVLFNEKPSAPHFLSGFFDSENEAADAWADLRKAFTTLPANPDYSILADRDWKEAYKTGLHPWRHGRLHWVPEWHRATYRDASADDAVVYFDAGLAFGTGDHPTTRLCALRLVDFLASKNDPAPVRVIDAGCGSGILALSAAKLGCAHVHGFDRDKEAVQVSRANRETNELSENAVAFSHDNLENGLRKNGPADLVLANIISDVLCIYADNLLAAIAPGGTLALGGILATEQTAVRQVFETKAKNAWPSENFLVDGRIMGDWSDLAFSRP